MEGLAALSWSICATVAGAASHVEAPGTTGSSASTSGEKKNCPGTIEARLFAVQRGIWCKAAGATAMGRGVPRAAIRGPFNGGEQARRPGADDDDAAPRFLGLRVKRPMAATR